jgi:hypothetical protein
MKRALQRVFIRLILPALLGTLWARSATVSWDGGGGNFSWQTPANWSGDVLPGANDDVLINTGGGITITSSATVIIRSLQCSNNLALTSGTFRVAVNSAIQGQLFVTGNPVISASGGNSTLIAPAATNVDGLGLEAVNGGSLSLPSVSTYTQGGNCLNVVWQANGSNSLLNLPALTSLTGASCAGLTVQALGGGVLRLTNLATISEGALSFLADGSSSLLDVSALQQSPGNLRTVSFEARNGGTLLMPQFTGGSNVTVVLKPNAFLPFTQLRELSGFTVTGTNAEFSSLTNLTWGDVTVSSNCLVRAPNLTTHSEPDACIGHTWLATGAGSTLDFSGLTNFVGSSCGFLTVRATAGGTVLFTNLPAVSEGTANFTADGSNSVLNLSGLRLCPASLQYVTFNVSNAGTILMPLFPGGPLVVVTIASGGTLPTAQLTELGGFTVTGAKITFLGLTNIAVNNVTVNGGAVVAAPNLTTHRQSGGCFGNTWLVSGPGSVLDLSHLTSLTGASCGAQNLSATSGGLLLLNNLPSIPDGTLAFLADGSNSVVNLASLASTTGLRSVTFSAANGGTFLAPLFFGATNCVLSMQNGGVFPAAQQRQLLGFTVAGMPVNFSGLTNLGVGNVTVSGGGTTSLPNLTQYIEPDMCVGNTWQATGTGSLLDFPGLTNLVGASCGQLNVNATSGGLVRLARLGTIGEGTVSFLADGANSVLDLGLLTQCPALLRNVSFEARNSGIILLPVFEGGTNVLVTIRSGGALNTSQLRLLKSLTVSGTSLVLPGLTNVFAGDLVVDQGAVLTLPSVFNLAQADGCGVSTWTPTGTGSVLNLHAMTNLSGFRCGSLNINALSAGSINLSNLLTIADGFVAFVADGTNSRVDLAALQSSLASTRSVSFESRASGNIFMPLMLGGVTVGVVLKTNGVMSVGQLTRLNAATAQGASLNFTSLTNLDGGGLAALTNGSVTAPLLSTYNKGASCIPATWLAAGAGSVLNLPALTQVTGGSICAPLTIQSGTGGQVLLVNLTNILSGAVTAVCSDPGSVLDLHSLINFLNPFTLSRLTATNAGAVLLNFRPFFLSGVAVNFAPGTPGFPATTLAATNLWIHGSAWHSYRIEARDPSVSTNPFAFLQRVPLTNDFQSLGPTAAANSEFRGWEFVADPFLLELLPVSGGVDLVFYAPANQSFEVQATNTVTAPLPWPVAYDVTMTNTFRVLPREPLTNTQRFFKVIPL